MEGGKKTSCSRFKRFSVHVQVLSIVFFGEAGFLLKFRLLGENSRKEIGLF